MRDADQPGPVTASVPDTLRVLGAVLLPLVARGLLLRRPRVVALAERLDADRRLVHCLQGMRRRYGAVPLRLRVPFREIVLVLAADDVRRVLDASPEPYATAAREKVAALARFQPHGVLISSAADRPDRRRFTEAVLDTGRPCHHLAERMTTVVHEEVRTLLVGTRGAVDWRAYGAAWFRTVRRITLGDAARDDTVLTDLLARLRADANWVVAPQRPGVRDAFLARLRGHLDRAEPGSLAAVAAATPTTPHTAAAEQVPQWLFAFDAAGMAAFRALALLATHPGELRAVRAEIAARAPELPGLRAAVLESVRLWPTTPAILRETTAPTELGGRTLRRGTLVVILAALLHRDGERHRWADDFTPRLWRPGSRPAVLVPFSAGPATCPGRDLVLFLTSTFLATLLDGRDVRVASRPPIRPGRPLPGTLDPFALRFALTPRT